jgi:uncharacterized membrane protein YeaQ/YmgE (transglycosylase-associated protein family)
MTAWIILLVQALIFGAIARNMARKRGRSGWWFLAGFFLSVIGCLIVGLIGRTQENIDAMHGRTKA